MISYRLGSATVNTQRIVNALSGQLREAVLDAAAVFRDNAQATVHIVTGELQESIHADLVNAGPNFVQAAVAPAYDAANKYGFEPAYARRLEYGFIGTDSLGRHYHQPPFPYMRPAWDEGQDQAFGIVHDELTQAIAGA